MKFTEPMDETLCRQIVENAGRAPGEHRMVPEYQLLAAQAENARLINRNVVVEFPSDDDGNYRFAKTWFVEDKGNELHICASEPEYLLEEIKRLKNDLRIARGHLTKDEMIELYSNYKSAESISAGLIQICDCRDFKARFTITFDSQDLYERGATKCQYCEKPFRTQI